MFQFLKSSWMQSDTFFLGGVGWGGGGWSILKQITEVNSSTCPTCPLGLWILSAGKKKQQQNKIEKKKKEIPLIKFQPGVTLHLKTQQSKTGKTKQLKKRIKKIISEQKQVRAGPSSRLASRVKLHKTFDFYKNVNWHCSPRPSLPSDPSPTHISPHTHNSSSPVIPNSRSSAVILCFSHLVELVMNNFLLLLPKIKTNLKEKEKQPKENWKTKKRWGGKYWSVRQLKRLHVGDEVGGHNQKKETNR